MKEFVFTTLFLDGVELVSGGLDKFLDLLDGSDGAIEANPFEGWLTALDHLGLSYQTDGLEHVGDIIKPSDLGLEHLVVKGFSIGDAQCSLLERNHILPRHKEADELLAEVAK